MDEFAAYQAAAYSVRDRLVDRWNATQQVRSFVAVLLTSKPNLTFSTHFVARSSTPRKTPSVSTTSRWNS